VQQQLLAAFPTACYVVTYRYCLEFIMASSKKASKHAAAASNLVSGPTKRLQKANKRSALQLITIDEGTQPLSLRQAIAAASQGTNFETQICNAGPEATIVALLKCDGLGP
jgi:hypothetical protein